MDGASAWRRFRDVTLPMISPALFFMLHHPHDRRPDRLRRRSTPRSSTRATRARQSDAALFYVDLPLPAGVRVLQHGLRVGAGVAALRDQHRDHGRSDRRQPALRLLRGGAAMRDRPAGARRRSRPRRDAAAAAAAPQRRRRRRRSPERGWLVAGALHRCCSSVFASSSSTRSSGCSAPSFKPRGETFDNTLIPQHWRGTSPGRTSRSRIRRLCQRRAGRALVLEQLLDQRPRRAQRDVLERARRVRVRVLPLPAAELPLRRSCSRR